LGYKTFAEGINTLNNLESYTDVQLVAGIKTKNNAIFKYIIKLNFRAIKQYVLLNSGSSSDANDIFQEALIILYRKVKEDSFELTSSLSTFLYSIAKLLWLKELSKRTKNASITEELDYIVDDNESISEQIHRNERLKLYRQKYDELSDDCKKILQMFLMKITISEITKIMGYSSEQHTRNRRYRCKESLIKRIRDSKTYNELGYEYNKVN
jgi:RNA polymerase sigma factor (sigma-70 family)